MSQLLKFREKLNITQDELAQKSGVSVRTIQRVEAGANLKGHTLKAISNALNVNPSELNRDTSDNETTEGEAFHYPLIKFINLSSLLFFIPLGNVFIPLLIMHLRKEKNEITRQIVSVQIMWTIVSAISFLATPFIQKWFSLNRQSIILVLMACILVNVFIIFRNALEIDKNQKLYVRLNFSLI